MTSMYDAVQNTEFQSTLTEILDSRGYACHKCICQCSRFLQPPRYSQDSYGQDLELVRTTGLPPEGAFAFASDSIRKQYLEGNLAHVCPKCLEQVTRTQHFSQPPEHDHPSPQLWYEIERPIALRREGATIGWSSIGF